MQIVEINEADLSRIQALYAEIERTRLHVEALEASMKSLLQTRYGIDLDRETWAIDLQRGTLKHNEVYDDKVTAMVEAISDEEFKTAQEWARAQEDDT